MGHQTHKKTRYADHKSSHSTYRYPLSKIRLSTNRTVYSRKDALAAGEESLELLLGHRDQSVINNLDQIRDAGWSTLPATDTITHEYDEPDGPFASLGIVASDGNTISVKQDKRFDNCLHQDNVRLRL